MSSDIDKAANSLRTVQEEINKTISGGKKAAANLGKNLNIGDAFGKNLQHGIEIGLSHAVGAISVGANPFTSLTHELTRNISISAFHTLLQALKGTGDQAKVTANDLKTLKDVGQEFDGQFQIAGEAFGKINRAAHSAAPGLEGLEIRLLAISVAAVVVGKALAALGDSILKLANNFASLAGETTLALSQLGNILDSTGEAVGRNLGSIEEWNTFIKELSVISGTSQKSLVDFGVSFAQVGAAAGLTGSELQKLIEISAFTTTRFRNATEQATNFRQALAGNVRFLINNINIGATLADTTEIITDALEKQLGSREKAVEQVNKLSTAQKVLLALELQSAPIIKTIREETGNYEVETRKLNATLENLQIVLGQQIQSTFASFARILRETVQAVIELPEPVLNFIANTITATGVIAKISGELLKLLGIVGVVAAVWKTLNHFIGASIPILGKSLANVLSSAATKLNGSRIAVASLGNFFTVLTKAVGAFLLRWGLIGTAITLVVVAVQNLENRFRIFSTILNSLTPIFSTLSNTIKDWVNALGLADTATQLFKDSMNILMGIIVVFVEIVAYLVLLYFKLEEASSRAGAAVNRFFKASPERIKQFTDAQEKAAKSAEETSKFIDNLDSVLKLLRSEIGKTTDEADDFETAFEGLNKAMEGFGNKSKIGAEGAKILERALERARDAADAAEVALIRQRDGEAAASDKEFQLLLEDIREDLKRAGQEFDKNDPKWLEFIENITKARDRLKDFKVQLESLKAQETVFKNLLGQVENLRKSFDNEILELKDSITLQKEANTILADSNLSGQEANRIANEETKIRKATLEIDKKIEKIRQELSTPQKAGETLVTLDPDKQKELEAQLAEATKDRELILKLILDKGSEDELKRVLEDINSNFDKLADSFQKDLNVLNEEITLLEQFNADIEKGTTFAENQNTIRETSAKLTREINELQNKIFSDELDPSLREEYQERLTLLTRIRDLIAFTTPRKQAIQAEVELNKAIKGTQETLEDQLSILEQRSKLFEEGVLKGDFTKAQDRIRLLSSALDELLAQRVTVEREGLISDEAVAKINTQIGKIKEALKAANFVNDIRELLQVIPDAISEALNEGVIAVFRGTQTISQLFENMAQNILLSLSKIFANRALEGIGGQIELLAEKIAKSDLGRAIGEALGINIDALSFGGAGTPEDQLKTAIQANTSIETLLNNSVTLLKTSIDALIARLGGGTTLPTQTTTPITEDEFSLTGLQNLITQETQELEISWTDDLEEFYTGGQEALLSGLTNTESLWSGGINTLFTNIGGFLTDALSSLTGLFSGGGGGFDFLGLITKGLNFFGFSRGGIVPGQKSKDDNVITALASGEGVVNSDAVNFYGGKRFIDSLNTMSLPQSFFSDLQSSSASNRLAGLSQTVAAPTRTTTVAGSERPINITVIDRSPKLDPASFKMKPSEVTQIFVQGVKKDKVIRRVIREDLKNSGVTR